MNPTTNPDPAIEEIREVRHRISANFDHDPAKLVAFLMEFQEQFRERMVYAPIPSSGAQNIISSNINNTAGPDSSTTATNH